VQASLGCMTVTIQWILLHHLVHMSGLLSAGEDLPSSPYPVDKGPLNKKSKSCHLFLFLFWSSVAVG